MKFDRAISQHLSTVARSIFDQLPVANAPEKDETAPNPAERNDGETTRDRKYFYVSAVREPQRLVFFDLKSGKRKDFILPERLHQHPFSAYLLSVDQMLINVYPEYGEYWRGGPIDRLYWVDPQGKIQREQELKLTGGTPPTLPEVAWAGSLLAPIAIVWIAGFLLEAPLALMQMNLAGDFRSAEVLVAHAAWPPLIVVLVVAAVLAAWTLRLQRKYRRPATAAWTTFVFLFGVPGFLAYLVENRRPKLEACVQCGQWAPRDRDACAAVRSVARSCRGTGMHARRAIRSFRRPRTWERKYLHKRRSRFTSRQAPITRRGSVRVMISLMPVWLKPL